jgi:dolichol-phosphate mannosyltransferase
MNPLIVIPTYNEVQNVEGITTALLALGIPGLSVLIVDDQSPDGTGELAERLAQHVPGRIRVLHRNGQRGLGRAYVDGFQWALEQGADPIIQMDADFSHSPNYIPAILEETNSHDVVVGSRYVKGGQVDRHWSLNRYALSWGANVYARTFLGIKTQDSTAGFKCWRRTALEAINLSSILSDGYVFQVEMTYVAERLGLSIVEMPIYFEDRRIGKSKMSIPVKLEAAWRVFHVGWRHRHVRPLPLAGYESSSRIRPGILSGP